MADGYIVESHEHPEFAAVDIEELPIAIARFALPDGELVQCNERICELFETERSGVIGSPGLDWTHPDDQHEMLEAVIESERLGRPVQVESRGLVGDGRIQWRRSDVMTVTNSDGSQSLMFASREITEEREEAERSRVLFERSPVAMAEISVEGRLLRVNNGFAELLAVDASDLVGAPWRQLVDPSTRWVVGRPETLEQPGSAAEVRFTRADGREMWVQLMLEPIGVAHGTSKTMLCVVIDVAEERQRQRELEFRALHDPLTGLANRSRLVEELEATSNLTRAVLFLDLDRFKDVNDQHGHEAGDDLLVQVADRLHSAVRPPYVVARIGGDEFVVLCPDAELDTADKVALRLQHVIASEPFVVGGQALPMTTAVGISLGTPGTPGEQLIREADVALYRAKARGRSRIQVFDIVERRRQADRLRVAEELERAIFNGEIVPHYQPLLDIDAGRLVGVEALARWHRPDGSIGSPAQFIPIAEETGLIVPLGAAILEQACTDAAAWNADRDEHVAVSVNLSARHCSAVDVDGEVRRVLDLTGLSPDDLVLELTETAVMSDAEAIGKTLAQVRRRGVRWAIDDFGTGYSSLAYLRRFSIDILKIDRSFIADLASDPDARAIVGAIIQMASSLGLMTLAEGVETEAQRSQLADLGCDRVQGFLFSPPVPLGELLAAHLSPPSSEVSPVGR